MKIDEPTKKISKKAVTIWRISDTFKNVVTLLVLATFLILHYTYGWYDWIGYLLYVLIGLAILLTIYDLSIHPIYLQRTWRYDIDENYIQIKYGFLNKQYIIVPVSRIEYVNTKQGPLLRRYGLSIITIGTIASQHEIPAIPEKEATHIRNKIVFYAQIEDSHSEGHSEEKMNDTDITE